MSDYNIINRHAKELHSKRAKLDEPTAIKYVEALKQCISGINKLDKINSIVVLAKCTDLFPQSDVIHNQLDSSLFATLFEIASSENVANETLRSILKIAISFLSGVIPVHGTATTFHSVILNAYNNYALIENLANKLTDLDLMISTGIVDFISKLIYRCVETKNDEYYSLLLKNITLSQFVSSFAILSPETSADLFRLGFSQSFLKSLKLARTNLKSMVIKPEIPFHASLLNDVVTGLSAAINEQDKLGDKADAFARAGFTNDPKAFIVEHFTVLGVLELMGTLGSPNMTLRKTYFEHIMLAEENSHFPISLFTIHIKEMMTDLDVSKHPGFKNFAYLFNNELTYSLMLNALSFWMGSKAVHGDCPHLFKLLDSLLDYCDEFLQKDTFENLLVKLSEITYIDFKKYQLEKIKQRKRDNWAVMLKDFNKSISEEVRSFVQDQRFLELSKGSWVHTYNPLEAPPKNSTKLPYYFITLSSNNKALIYKEFSKKQDSAIVNVDMDGNKIDFSSIVKIQADSMTKTQSSEEANATRLIDINSRLQVSKIMMILKDTRIFEFYVSNQKLLFVWLDGLNMLINENSEISDDTKQQIDALIRVRSDVQLITLPDEVPDTDVVEPDVTELAGLATGFYYA